MQEPAAPSLPTTRHRSSLGEWERAWQRSSPPLRGLIGGYHGYRQRMAQPASHRGIPGPTLPLVISFGPPQIIARSTGAGTPAVTVDSFLAGIDDRYVLIDADEFHGIQVDLDPAAAYRLLGHPLRDLTGEVVPLETLWGADAHRLVDDLATAPDWPSRFRRLDRALALRLADAVPAPEVLRSWERIVASQGRVRVGELAAHVGWSTRHLSARFGEQLGLSPKRMARLTRFSNAASMLSRQHAVGLADIAVATGYADQAHLSNDVRAMCGLSPSQLQARHLPDSGGVFDLNET